MTRNIPRLLLTTNLGIFNKLIISTKAARILRQAQDERLYLPYEFVSLHGELVELK